MIIIKNLKEYQLYLKQEKKLSPNTIESYFNDLSLYLEFIIKYHKVKDPNDITTRIVEQYLKNLKNKGFKQAGIMRKLSSIKGFHKFLILESHVKTDVASEISIQKKELLLPKILSKNDIIKLITVLDEKTPLGYRNKALLELLYGSGLRVSELLNLKLLDI